MTKIQLVFSKNKVCPYEKLLWLSGIFIVTAGVIFCSNNQNLILLVYTVDQQLISTTNTSQNSFNKISSHEIIIFELKNDGKKWSRIYFEIDRAPSELLLPSAKISAQIGRIGLEAQQVSLKGLGQFQNKFQTTFYHHF